MTAWHWLLVIAGLVIFAVMVWVGLSLWLRRHIRMACEQFHSQSEKLATEFLDAANATGLPRGLRWVACDWNPEIAFARERRTGQIVAFVSVTIQFEAIEGGEMEGVAAVRNLRNASAVFFYDRGRWRTAGRAVFNLNPGEALERLKDQYERLHAPPAADSR